MKINNNFCFAIGLYVGSIYSLIGRFFEINWYWTLIGLTSGIFLYELINALSGGKK